MRRRKLRSAARDLVRTPKGLVVLGLAVVVLAFVVLNARAWLTPSLAGEYDGLTWYQSFDVGTRLTSGQILLINNSDEPMTVLEVRPLLESGGALTFLGAYLAGDDKEFAMTDYLVEFPPSRAEWGAFVPAEGGQVPPQSELFYTGIEIMMGFSVDAEGRHEIHAVEIDYEAAGVRKTLRIDTGIVICVPKSVECREDD